MGRLPFNSVDKDWIADKMAAMLGVSSFPATMFHEDDYFVEARTLMLQDNLFR